MLLGIDGEAYNLADTGSDISLKDLAGLVAGVGGVSVVFDLPDAQEAAGYSVATLALMNGSKAQSLGWRARYTIADGMRSTVQQMRKMGWATSV